MLLKTIHLKHFLYTDDSKSYIKSALDNMISVHDEFFPTQIQTNNDSAMTSSQESDTPIEKSSFGNFFGCPLQPTGSTKKTNLIKTVSKVRDLEREIKFLSTFICNSNLVEKIKSNASFWKKR